MRKIINISSFSRSRVNQDPVDGSYYGWHSQYSRALAATRRFQVESWSIDVGVFRGKSYDREGIVYRLLPSRLYLTPGREVSTSVLRALRYELHHHDVVLHLHDFHNWQAYAIALMFPTARIVAHYHGATKRPLQKLTSVRRAVGAPLFLLEHGAESLAMRQIKHVFLANTRDRAWYQERKIQFSFCPMAPDLKFFTLVDHARSREQLGVAAAPLLLNVGGFGRPKNLGLLIDAFADLRRQVDARLVLVGPTYERGYRRMILQQMRALGLEKVVSVVDFVPRSTLNLYYNAADVLVVTSNSDEGGPTVILESLALGTPVVSTPVGLTEDILPKTSGMLHLSGWTPGAVSRTVQDVLQSAPTTLRTAVIPWTWEDVMKTTIPVYERLFRS